MMHQPAWQKLLETASLKLARVVNKRTLPSAAQPLSSRFAYVREHLRSRLSGSPRDGRAQLRGIVILSIFDWWYHPHGHSDIQLANAFSKRMPVLFVNSIGMRLPRRGTATSPLRRIGRKVRSTLHFVRFVDPRRRIAVATPLSLPIYSGRVGRLISLFVEWQIRLMLWWLHLSKPIILLTVPSYSSVALRLPREALLYNRSDKHSEYTGANKELLQRLEETLFSRADAVLYAGQQLFEAEKDRVSGQAVFIGHGLDVGLFTPDGPVAVEMTKIPRPRVGFFGSLSEAAVDLAFIASLARLCPEINFVLGGPLLDGVEQLRNQSNVYLFGPCAHREMPARWRSLDAAILPYRRTPWDVASEPIKLNEILAMGLRAVATPLPAFTRHAGLIRTAEDPAGFAESLRQLLATASTHPEAPNPDTSFNSWDSIADRIDRLSQSMGSDPTSHSHASTPYAEGQ